MKLQSYKKGAVVRLTDHRKNAHFKKYEYDQMDSKWKRFWDEYVDRNLYIKDFKNNPYDDDDHDHYIYLEPLPDYVSHDIPFYIKEIDGVVPCLPEELFKI